MINLNANTKLKNLGCKWDGATWVAPELAKAEYQAIMDKYYSDLVVVEIAVNDNKLNGQDWAYSHVRTVAGYIVAKASGRDSGAQIMDGVAVINGKFNSGGSMKNYICTHSEDLKLRFKIASGCLDELEQESKEKGYTYTILEQEKPLKLSEKMIEIKIPSLNDAYITKDNQTYLGDGVYITFDGYGYILRANHHDEHECSDQIYIDPTVLKKLNGFVSGMKSKYNLEG